MLQGFVKGYWKTGLLRPRCTRAVLKSSPNADKGTLENITAHREEEEKKAVTMPTGRLKPYPGAKFCKTQKWCGHTTRNCCGIEEKDRRSSGGRKGGGGDKKKRCYICTCADHLKWDCPKVQPKKRSLRKRKTQNVKCFNCGGPHLVYECDAEDFDPDRVNENRRASSNEFESRREHNRNTLKTRKTVHGT